MLVLTNQLDKVQGKESLFSVSFRGLIMRFLRIQEVEESHALKYQIEFREEGTQLPLHHRRIIGYAVLVECLRWILPDERMHSVLN